MVPDRKNLPFFAYDSRVRCEHPLRPSLFHRTLYPTAYLSPAGRRRGGEVEEEKKSIYSFLIILRRDQGTSLKPVDSNSGIVHAKRPRSISGNRPHYMRLRRQGKKERQRERERRRDRERKANAAAIARKRKRSVTRARGGSRPAECPCLTR
jgi:hypothetical protein